MRLSTRVLGAGKRLLLGGALLLTFFLFAALSMRLAIKTRDVVVPTLDGKTVNEASFGKIELLLRLVQRALRGEPARRAPREAEAERDQQDDNGGEDELGSAHSLILRGGSAGRLRLCASGRSRPGRPGREKTDRNRGAGAPRPGPGRAPARAPASYRRRSRRRRRSARRSRPSPRSRARSDRAVPGWRLLPARTPGCGLRCRRRSP